MISPILSLVSIVNMTYGVSPLIDHYDIYYQFLLLAVHTELGIGAFKLKYHC